MKTGAKLTLLCVALGSLALAPAVVTLASEIKHAPDSKTYEISSLPKGDANVQDLYAYFDRSSGEYVQSAEGETDKTSFTLTSAPIEMISVSVGGALNNNYSVSGSTLTFDSAPAAGSLIAFTYRVQAGVAAHPYLLSNSVHLRNLAKLQNTGVIPDGTHFALSTSFQYEGVDGSSNNLYLEPIGNETYPFKGTFDGKNKAISDLRIQSGAEYVGMFGKIAGGEVKNLILASPTLVSTYATAKVGFVCGNFASGTLSHIGVYGGDGTAHISKAQMTLASGTKKTVRYLIGAGTIPADVVFIVELPSMKAGQIYCDVNGVASGWDSVVYAYAWKNGESSTINASWPGVAMTLDHTGVYRAAIADTFDRIIFSYGWNGSSVSRQTADQTINWSTPYCSITSTNTASWTASSWPSDASTNTQTNITATSVSIYRNGSDVQVQAS